MQNRPFRRTSASRLATAFCAPLLACLMLASGHAQAACGCTDDGHGSPQGPKATGASAWLASLLDWQSPKRSDKAGATR